MDFFVFRFLFFFPGASSLLSKSLRGVVLCTCYMELSLVMEEFIREREIGRDA